MRRLLYCVFFGSERDRLRRLRGVDDRPVALVSRGRLCAATSLIADAPLVPTIERIQAYERVVEAYFADRSVIPMRFGSILESREQVCRFLEERAEVFGSQLKELEGCVEMGIRLVVGPSAGSSNLQRESKPAARRPAPPGSGRAYLEARAKRLPPDEGPVERYRRAFQGLFTRLKVELSSPLRLIVEADGKLRLAEGVGAEGLTGSGEAPQSLSLAFLVPRERVEAFRAAFERMGDDAAGSSLSGPWPPYSFVARS
ncbi:MAG: GvpL/GvpF family gas vesicle protein [Myxococcales bacterium]|jgi:hypothetical protein